MQARNRTSIAVAVLIIVVALSATGCLTSRPSAALTVGVLGLPSVADPAIAANPGLLGLAYETLVARGPDGNYYAGLAKDWTVSADGRVLTLNLKPGVTFSDGSPLTGESVKSSLQRLMEKDPAALGPVEKVDVAGTSGVTLTLSRPYPPIWGALASARAAIAVVPGSGLPLGTGPYVIKELTAQAMTLSVNPAYRWAPDYYRVRGPARVATIVVKQYADVASLAAAVTASQLDVAGGAELPVPGGWTQATAPGESLLYMGFDVRQAPYGDARIRRAIALMLAPARAAAAKTLPGWTSTVSFLPRAVYCATETAPSGDAAALMAEAGYARGADGFYASGGAPLKLALHSSQRAEDQAVGQAVVDTLKAAGIDATLDTSAAGATQAFLARYNWGEPDILYYMLHTGAEANRSGYSDARADRLLEAGAGAMNLGDRQAVYQALQQRLAEDSPWVPLLGSNEAWVIKDTTTNIRVGTGGRLFLTTARVK